MLMGISQVMVEVDYLFQAEQIHLQKTTSQNPQNKVQLGNIMLK